MTIPFVDHYDAVLLAGLAFAALTALAGRFVKTPYGRFGSSRYGPEVPIRLGWLLMEAPAIPVFYAVFAMGSQATEPVPRLFAAVWALHYGNRALAFPLLMRARPGSRMSVSVFGTGIPVVVVHAWLYATWLGTLGTHLTTDWLTDPRFLLGLPLYLLGYGLTVHSEGLLRGLRDATAPGTYAIPQGGGFRWVSSPHYLGEILAWTGLALASWCPGGLFVLTVTLANLVPRALATHRWYRQTFPDYPPARRALVPGLL